MIYNLVTNVILMICLQPTHDLIVIILATLGLVKTRQIFVCFMLFFVATFPSFVFVFL